MEKMEKLIIFRKRAPYEQFVEQMERIGLNRVPFNLQEKDIDIADNDQALYIQAKDCQSISIRGILESKIKGKFYIEPHKIVLKMFDYNGNEMMPEDAIQFSITELKKTGLPTSDQEKINRTIYYSYPYKMASLGLKIKKGIMITKDRRLEIRVIRNGIPVKIGKAELSIECDKWIKDNLK